MSPDTQQLALEFSTQDSGLSTWNDPARHNRGWAQKKRFFPGKTPLCANSLFGAQGGTSPKPACFTVNYPQNANSLNGALWWRQVFTPARGAPGRSRGGT